MAARKTARRATKKARTTKAKPARATAARRAATKPAKVPPGAFIHIELYSHDPEATQRFYTDVFGWRFEDMSYGEGMSYRGFRAPGPPHGGVMPRQGMPPEVPGTLAYIKVASLADAARRIEDAGGKVHKRMEVPNVGWFAIFEAPGGIAQAVWQEHPSFQPKP